MKGAYILVAELKDDSKIEIGKLCTFEFKKGYYCYVGSAVGNIVNIESRTARHKRLATEKAGKLRWHIDYFLTSPNVSVVDIKKFEDAAECDISKRLEQRADKTIRGFGSSDCARGCMGHLHYFKNYFNPAANF